MSDIIFKNERTLASAGSGKTYDLTNRIIALVAGGAKPEEIYALTFTRKAAGEFFNKTMQKLASASTNEAIAKDLSEKINKIAPVGELSATDFRGILEKFSKSFQSLNFSTIDSFTSKFLKLFTSELGINENVTILDEFSESKAKEKAISQTLKQFASDRETIAEFAQAIKEASFGKDKKTIISTINNFIDEAHFSYLIQPNKNSWQAISAKYPLLNWDKEDYIKTTQELEQIYLKKSDKKKIPILTFFKKSDFDYVNILGKLTSEIAKQFRENGTTQGAEKVDDDEYELIDKNIKRLLFAQTDAAKKALIAIYKIVSKYEKTYAETVRKQGLLSFNDMTIAIAKTQNPVERKFVEYRFDSRIKHWLFDEFQDTSRLQWDIFKDIIDEVLTDPSHEKSFYFVGDIKQSIYGWRGGDMKLFNEIYERYENFIEDNEQKKTSYRSCTAVIDFVNELFSNKDLLEKYFGIDATNAWLKIWKNHDVAQKNKKQKGEITIDVIEKNYSVNILSDTIYEYLKKINPIARKLTCAILVQTNRQAVEIIDIIRARVAAEKDDEKSNIRIASELDIYIAQDNLAIPVILALLKFAIHPQDSFAKNYVEMSPLKDILQNENWSKILIEKISSLGFANGLEEIVARLSTNLKNFDDFTKNRLSQFLEACRNFDASQNRDIDDFIDFIQKYKIREGAASDTIQVMSIHKAKGLDFDIVILPELGNSAGHNSKIKTQNNANVTYLPSKNICSFDENLKSAYDEFRKRDNFERLCKFYVALTRAKRAIHIILNKNKAEGKISDTGNFEHFLSKHFGIYDGEKDVDILPNVPIRLTTSKSDASWISDFPEEKFSPITETLDFSLEENKAYTQNEFEFDFLNQNTSNLIGLAAHSIFENLNNKTGFDEAVLRAKKNYLTCPQNFEDAVKSVKKSLKNQEIKEVFECEDFYAELPYTILNETEVEVGRIDRINFFDNRTRAEIIDFKTDIASVEELKSRHTNQLKRYATALSKSSNIPLEKIALKILSTHNAKLIEIC